jgi:hypothetical protein
MILARYFTNDSNNLNLSNKNYQAVLEEAKDFLEEAIKYNEKIGGRSDGGHVDDTLLMSLDDRVSCYIEYGKVLKALNQYKLLEKISLQAEQKFEGLSKSFHFIKLRSDIYLEQNKTEMSLRILMDVPPVSNLRLFNSSESFQLLIIYAG